MKPEIKHNEGKRVRSFKLSVYLKDEDYNFDYRYGKMLTLKHLLDEDEWEMIKDNLTGYLQAVRNELIEELEGEEFGDEDGTDNEPNKHTVISELG